VLLAFINPSGPTREPQELSVLVSDIVLISAAEHTLAATRPGWERGLRARFSVGSVRIRP
jgi:hypothetical protein